MEVLHGAGQGEAAWGRAHGRAVPLAIAASLALFLIGLSVHYGFKAAEHRSAIMRWRPLVLRLARGEDVYRIGAYPNPPVMGLTLYPLALLPDELCAQVWFWLKVLMAAAAVFWSVRLASEPGEPVPPLAWIAVVLLSLRPLVGDLQHGNVNILILFVVLAGLWSFRRRHDWRAGLLLALATSYKVTPALFLPYFLYKRQWRVVLAFSAGLVLFLAVVPGLLLGFQRNLTLLRSWAGLMIAPYLVHGIVTTEQINQSLPGVLFRLCTKCDAIQLADGSWVSVNIVSMCPEAALLLLKALVAALLLLVAWLCRRPIAKRTDTRWAAEWALVLMAMLFISERSWKHHYVTMVLPYAVVVVHIARKDCTRAMRRFLVASLAGSLLLMGLTQGELGKLFAGGYGHKYMLAYGMYFYGALVVFAAVSVLLMRANAQAAAARVGSSAGSVDASRLSAATAGG